MFSRPTFCQQLEAEAKSFSPLRVHGSSLHQEVSQPASLRLPMLQLPFPSQLPTYLFLDITLELLLDYLQQVSLPLWSAVVDDPMALTELSVRAPEPSPPCSGGLTKQTTSRCLEQSVFLLLQITANSEGILPSKSRSYRNGPLWDKVLLPV